MRPCTPSLLAAFAVVASAAASHAATLSYTPANSFTAGASDISNFTGATASSNNVSGNNYLAHDGVGPLGQTFTTGTAAGGYTLTSLTLQQVFYSTYAQTDPSQTGGTYTLPTLTLRVSTISGSGSATTLTPFATETAMATGTESNQPANGRGNATTGNGAYVTLTFATPVSLMPGTMYAIDVAVNQNETHYFFETNGTSTDAAYAGGQAYNTTYGSPNAVNFDSGDRVFDLALTTVPEPATWWAGMFLTAGAGGLVVRRRRSLAA